MTAVSLEITRAAQALVAGDLVAFPTETVYGLGADALSAQAVAKIYALKGRPSTHPLIVHVPATRAIDAWAASTTAFAQNLMDAFWPGPLTLILRKSVRIPDAVTGGQDTVGLRCPAHPLAQALLAEFARGGSGAVAAPSANRFGHVSPTTAQHVRDEFGARTPLLLDGGPCEVGIESTIIDCTGELPVLLRPGAISRVQIQEATGLPVADRAANSPRVSGALPAHYQPTTRVELVESGFVTEKHRCALFAPTRPVGFAGEFRLAPTLPVAYARALYATLRELDTLHLEVIFVTRPPNAPAWEGVQDRLARSAAAR